MVGGIWSRCFLCGCWAYLLHRSHKRTTGRVEHESTAPCASPCLLLLVLQLPLAPSQHRLSHAGRPCAGKTLLARAIASNIDANFLKVVSSAIVDKYIGESARLIREMFGYARDHQPCIIFMDEIDAIGGRRFSEGTSADREIQRTLMELLSQLDGFDVIGKVGGGTTRGVAGAVTGRYLPASRLAGRLVPGGQAWVLGHWKHTAWFCLLATVILGDGQASAGPRRRPIVY